MNKNPETHEQKFTTLEEKAADEMEMAAKEDEERKKAAKTAQEHIVPSYFLFYLYDFFNRKLYITNTIAFYWWFHWQ